MNIQSILMSSPHERECYSTMKENSPSNNSVASPPLIHHGDNKSQFWDSAVNGSFPNNVFLPSSIATTSTESNNLNDGQSSNNLTNFVDLSSDQNMVCPLCKKVFRFEKNLLRHMQKTHATGEAESVLKCKLCNYTTRHYSNMYVHIRTHTGDKPYSCSGCGASFTQGSSLKLHIKSRHEDNTSLFSLTKKPGKNNLTKLWTRVYKKDLTKFSNYGLGNYFSPFTLPNLSNHSPRDFLLPFSNFLPYSRVPQIPSFSRCPPSLSHFPRNSNNLPLVLNRFQFLPSLSRTESIDPLNNKISNKLDYTSPVSPNNNLVRRPKKAILSISNFVNDDDDDDKRVSCSKEREDTPHPSLMVTKTEMEEYEENVSEILSVTDMESEEIIEKHNSFQDPLTDIIKSYFLKNNHTGTQEQIFQLFQTLGPNVLQMLKSIPQKRMANETVQYHKNPSIPSFLPGNDGSRELYNRTMAMNRNNLFSAPLKQSHHQALLNPHANQSLSSWNDFFSKISDMSDNIYIPSQPSSSIMSIPGRSTIPPSSTSLMFGLSGYPQMMTMIDQTSNQFLR